MTEVQLLLVFSPGSDGKNSSAAGEVQTDDLVIRAVAIESFGVPGQSGSSNLQRGEKSCPQLFVFHPIQIARAGFRAKVAIYAQGFNIFQKPTPFGGRDFSPTILFIW